MEKLEEKVITRGGVDYRVWVEPDGSTTPDEFDCYDAEAIDSWNRDVWRFVTVYVALADPGTCDGCGRHNVAEFDWLSGVEYGLIGIDEHGNDIDRDLNAFIHDEYANVYNPVTGDYTSETMVDGMIGELNALNGS